MSIDGGKVKTPCSGLRSLQLLRQSLPTSTTGAGLARCSLFPVSLTARGRGVVEDGLPEVTFELSPKGRKGANFGKSIPGGQLSKCKGPEMIGKD